MEKYDHIEKQNWFKRRRILAWFTLLMQCLIYFEYSAVSISALYYYKDDLKVQNPKFYYSLSMGAMYISIFISVITCARYMDKTRNLRRIALTTIVFSIVGNLTYTITISPYLPIIGRFLCGINDGVRICAAGELSRVYGKHELGKIFSTNEIVGLIVTSLAPCTPVLFTGINFHIGFWHITTNNFIGLFLAVVATIIWVATYLFLPNLTLEPIYKTMKNDIFSSTEVSDSVTNNNTNNATGSEIFEETNESFKPFKQHKKIPSTSTEELETISVLWTTKDIVQRTDVFFIILTQAFLSGQYYQMELLINMTALLIFQFNMTEISIATTIGVVFASLVMLAIRSRLLGSSVNIVFLFALSFVLATILESYLNIIILSGFRIKIILQATISIVVFLNTLQAFGAGSYTKIILFSMAPQHSAAIIESHRKASASFFICVAFFTASSVFSVQYLVTPVYNLISLVVAGALLYKRHCYIGFIKL
ncbi:uncharacterized protein [Clytia hemisphaerica]